MGGPGRDGPQRGGSSARRLAQVGHRATASPRGPAHGVAAPSPRRDAAPASSAQATALTPTPSTGLGSAAHGDSSSRFGTQHPGRDAEAGAEEARDAGPRLLGPREPMGA